MKLKLIAAAGLLSLTMSSYGVIVTVNNLANINPGIDLPFLDSAGNPLPTGAFNVAVGNYGGGVVDPLDPTNGFVQLGSTEAGSHPFGGGAVNGLSNNVFNLATAAAGAFIGQPVFVLISFDNGGTPEFAVWQSNATVLDDDPVLGEQNTAVNIFNGSGALVLGDTVDPDTNVDFGGGLGASQDFAGAIQLVPVPEPSSALLLGLGSLGLLIRRKR